MYLRYKKFVDIFEKFILSERSNHSLRTGPSMYGCVIYLLSMARRSLSWFYYRILRQFIGSVVSLFQTSFFSRLFHFLSLRCPVLIHRFSSMDAVLKSYFIHLNHAKKYCKFIHKESLYYTLNRLDIVSLEWNSRVPFVEKRIVFLNCIVYI